MRIRLLHFRSMTHAPIRLRRLIGLAGLVCCAWAADPTGARSCDAIKIGAVLPFSGGVELYRRQARLGLDLAAKDINAGGGILGRGVELIYQDDKAAHAATNPGAWQ